mmetsp:Transcript_18348/g.27505  ORF Transcript_18348/g.27505 Transcript_18348/m.27505 type:complete len:222 (+) Transcript_18348:549-1214(+)
MYPLCHNGAVQAAKVSHATLHLRRAMPILNFALMGTWMLRGQLYPMPVRILNCHRQSFVVVLQSFFCIRIVLPNALCTSITPNLNYSIVLPFQHFPSHIIQLCFSTFSSKILFLQWRHSLPYVLLTWHVHYDCQKRYCSYYYYNMVMMMMMILLSLYWRMNVQNAHVYVHVHAAAMMMMIDYDDDDYYVVVALNMDTVDVHVHVYVHVYVHDHLLQLFPDW